MPAKSEKQRRYLNWRFGHRWVKKHGFDNKGKLPMYVGDKNESAMNFKGWFQNENIYNNALSQIYDDALNRWLDPEEVRFWQKSGDTPFIVIDKNNKILGYTIDEKFADKMAKQHNGKYSFV